MSLIRKPQEIIVAPTIQALIYGQAGTGKSTLALSAPDPLLLDFDNGVGRVNAGHRCDTVQVENYKMALDVLDEDLSPYKSIIIDTGGKLLDMMSDWLISNNSKLSNSNGTLTLQGFGERKAEFKNFCRKVRSLNKHLIFVAHRETQKEGENYRYVPIFGGSSYDTLVTELDLVGYLEIVGKKRIITFNPTERNDGKNTINMPPAIELPITVDERGIALDNSFIKDYVIKGFINRLNEQKKINEEYSMLIDVINEIIESVKDDVSANEALNKMKDLKYIGNLRVFSGNALKKKTESIGLVYDKDSKSYVNPVVEKDNEETEVSPSVENNEKEEHQKELFGTEG